MSKSRRSQNPKPTVSHNLFPQIENAPRERSQLEKDFFGWSNALTKMAVFPPGVEGISLDAFEARVVEVYRLCYERSVSQDEVVQPPAKVKEQLEIVRDFAAYFPHLIFSANWLQRIMRDSHLHGFGPDSFQGKLLHSIATGLRSAASGARYQWQADAMQVRAAKMARLRIYEELSAWNKALERALDHPREWISARATEKVGELIRESSLLKPCHEKLLQLLEKERLYEASVLMAANVFGVRARNIEEALNPAK